MTNETRSANSTRSVVGFCTCCLMLTAHTHQFQQPLVRYQSDSQLFSPSLPPFTAESNRKQLHAKVAQKRCADKNVSVNAHRCVHICTLLCIRACICGHIRKLGQCAWVRDARQSVASLYLASAVQGNAMVSSNVHFVLMCTLGMSVLRDVIATYFTRCRS